LEEKTRIFSVDTNHSSRKGGEISEWSAKSAETNINKDYLANCTNSSDGYFSIEEDKELTHEIKILEDDEIEMKMGRSENILYEKTVGRGIGAALEIMRNQGILHTFESEWAGRNQDRKFSKIVPKMFFTDENMLQNDVDTVSRRVDVALKRTDNYGRPLTVKAAYRELCYRFHGKGPSKNRQQKRVYQYVNELAVKKKLTSMIVSRQTNKMHEIQQKLDMPYILLDKNSTIGDCKFSVQVNTAIQ